LAANFKGLEFIFDNKSSDFYGLKLYNSDTGSSEGDAGSKVEILEKTILRKPKTILFGTSQNTQLEFDLIIGSTSEVDAQTRSAISRWLLGRSSYLPLSIVQEDMLSTIYYVIFTEMKPVFYGNLNYAFVAHAKCNAPWAYMSPKTSTYNYSGSSIVSTTINYNNLSDNNDYTDTIVSFTMNGIGNYFTITNVTDNNRVFSFTNILPYETITVNGNTLEVYSSTGLKRVDSFNKGFVRFVPGINVLQIQGGINQLSFTTEFAVKAGG